MPYGVVIHPSNWVVFSEQQGRIVLSEAAARNIPVWSYDQWCDFWEIRDQWRLQDLSWEDNTLTFRATGAASNGDLEWLLPGQFEGHTLTSVEVDGRPIECRPVIRYCEPVVLVPQAKGSTECDIQAFYR
jgi:hypothetical protein